MSGIKHEAAGCPNCGAILDASTSMREKNTPMPEPGDISFCAYCGTLNMFLHDLSLVDAPQDKKDEVMRGPDGPGIMLARELIRQGKLTKPR